jgi:hypothetical protein
MKTISKLFENEPTQWGLRGDPCLWEEMKANLDLIAMPSTPADLEQILQTAFVALTEGSWDDGGPIFVASYDQGGMSSGMVCPEFWRDTAIPLIVSRYRAAREGSE